MPDHSRSEDLIKEIFEFLNQKKVSPEEGFLIAEEILLSSVERFAKLNNINPEDVKDRILGFSSGLNPDFDHPTPERKNPYMVGSGRGWIGNPKTTTENN